MFDSKKPQETAYPKRFTVGRFRDKHILTEKSAFANWRASDKCGNREVLRRLRSRFTAPKLNVGYTASQRFCFAPVISALNNLNDFEDHRSAEFKRLARSKQESNHCFEIFDRSNNHVEFESKIY